VYAVEKPPGMPAMFHLLQLLLLMRLLLARFGHFQRMQFSLV